jgi:tRNA-specific 2-thiouridylase
MITKPGRNKRVFVGVSGGVDSSVTALLLKLYGYDVTGVFIKTWQPEWIECTWRDERRDAMRVCAHLEIPFIELDLESVYKQGVADYMIAEYRAGRTPNPDVMCNREVKFGIKKTSDASQGGFLQFALEQGVDYVATGHYAQNYNTRLFKGIDPAKDQSYFLWTLTNEQLQHILFPVGHLPKSATRKIASWYRLPTATKKDSQGICFIGAIDMKEFLKHYIGEQSGNVLDESGKVIGYHDGALFFTLGERHGFTITSKGNHDAPYYIIAKDIAHNTITVSQNTQPIQQNQVITLINCVWREPILDKSYTAQIRYHGELKSCRIKQLSDNYTVIFDEQDKTLSPGQSIVVYDGEVCIGGGIVA